MLGNLRFKTMQDDCGRAVNICICCLERDIQPGHAPGLLLTIYSEKTPESIKIPLVCKLSYNLSSNASKYIIVHCTAVHCNNMHWGCISEFKCPTYCLWSFLHHYSIILSLMLFHVFISLIFNSRKVSLSNVFFYTKTKLMWNILASDY